MSPERDTSDPVEQFFRLRELLVSDSRGEDRPPSDPPSESSDEKHERVVQMMDSLREQLDGLGIDIRSMIAGSAGMKPDTTKSPQKTVGRFVIEGLIGQGGCGIVFRAFDPKLERRVALKMPLPAVLAAPSFKRFIFEAKAAARLSHPNVVGVYEASDEPGLAYIVSELCDGPSLATWMANEDSPTPPAVAAEILTQVAKGVEHAHRAGLLHRDIKPSNVLLFAKESASADDPFPFVPKLTDFGLATAVEGNSHSTSSQHPVGTIQYMSPEQAQGLRSLVGPGTDIYSLGMVLYELLAGRYPFEGLSSLELLQKIVHEPLPQLPETVPAELTAICETCLAKTAAKRYASAGELADDLRNFLEHRPISHQGPRRRRRQIAWIAGAAALAGIAALPLLPRSSPIVDAPPKSAARPGPAAPTVASTGVVEQPAVPAASFMGALFRWMRNPEAFAPLADCLSSEVERLDPIEKPAGEVIDSRTLPVTVTNWRDPQRQLTRVYALADLGGAVPWHQANQLAQAVIYHGQPGRLVAVESSAEYLEALEPLLSKSRYSLGAAAVWLGATDESEGGRFHWVTGEPVQGDFWERPLGDRVDERPRFMTAVRTDAGWRWTSNEGIDVSRYAPPPTLIAIEFELPWRTSEENKTHWLADRLERALIERMARFDAAVKATDGEPYLELARGDGPSAEDPLEGIESARPRARAIARLDALRSAFPQFFCEIEPSSHLAAALRQAALLPIVMRLGVPRDPKFIYYNPPLGTATILNPNPAFDSLATRFRQAAKAPDESPFPVAAPLDAIAEDLTGELPAGEDVELTRPATFPKAHQPATESSECLYLILTDPVLGDGKPMVIPKQYVADTDQDGLLEYVDAWGRPLRFIRWPTDCYAFWQDALPRLAKENGIELERPVTMPAERLSAFPFAPDELAPIYDRHWFDAVHRRLVLRQANPDSLQLALFRFHQLYSTEQTDRPPELFVDGDEGFPHIDFGFGINQRAVDGQTGFDDVARRYPIAPLIVSAGRDGKFGLYTPDPADPQGDTPPEASKRRAIWAALQLDYRCGRVDARHWRETLDNILGVIEAPAESTVARP